VAAVWAAGSLLARHTNAITGAQDEAYWTSGEMKQLLCSSLYPFIHLSLKLVSHKHQPFHQ
jgi:hypothetical protein